MDWFKVSCLCHPPWKRYTNPCWQVPLGWLGQKHWQSTVNRQISRQWLGRAQSFRILPPTAGLHRMDGKDAERNQLKKTSPNSHCLWVSSDLRWGGSRAPLLLNPSLPLWDPSVSWDGALISLSKGLSTLFYTMPLSSKMETAGGILSLVSTLALCDCHTHPFTVFLGHKFEDTQIPRSRLWSPISHFTSLNPEFCHTFPVSCDLYYSRQIKTCHNTHYILYDIVCVSQI